MQGRLRASKTLGFPVVRIDSSQGLIFQGDRNSAVTQIAVELNQDLELHLVKGKRLPPHAFSGFQGSSSEIFFSITPGASMCVGSMPKNHVLSLAGEIYGEPLLERLHHQNICQVQPAAYARMAQTLVRGASNDVQSQSCAAEADDAVLSFLEGMDQPDQQNIPSRAYKNVDLVRDFVALTHESDCDKPPTITDLTQQLFTSKTVLSVAIRQATGLSPLTFIRNVRLEQVRKALLSGVEPSGVGDVALRYGFPSRGHFSRYYRNFFGELPRDTLMNR